MNYLSARDVLVIHARIVEKTGGSQGVRDVGLLESAMAAPRQSFDGDDLHGGVFMKAAVLFQKLAANHPFVDGNKRTAVAVASRFLYINNYQLNVSRSELVEFTVRVVEDDLDRTAIAEWLEEVSSRNFDMQNSDINSGNGT